jgi:hypothetical protein
MCAREAAAWRVRASRAVPPLSLDERRVSHRPARRARPGRGAAANQFPSYGVFRLIGQAGDLNALVKLLAEERTRYVEQVGYSSRLEVDDEQMTVGFCLCHERQAA